MAHQLTFEKVQRDWERAHLPTEEVWKRSLEAYGFHSAKDEKLLQNASFHVPSSWDDQGSVWASPEQNWILVYFDPNAALPFRLFAKDLKAPMHSAKGYREPWVQLGRGWKVLDGLIESFQKSPIKSVQKMKSKLDPREIRY